MNLTGFPSLAWQAKVNILKLSGIGEIGKDLLSWMGDPYNSEKTVRRADVFIKGSVLFYLIESPLGWQDHKIEAGVILRNAANKNAALVPFITCFINAIKNRIDGRVSRHMDLRWYKFNVNDNISGRVFDKLCKYAKYEDEELIVAKELSIQASRDMAIKISRGELKREHDGKVITRLLEKLVIQKSPSSDKYILSKVGRRMLNGSQWMTVWLTENLVASGIPIDAIVWGLQEDSEEVDCALELKNRIWIFELKDRNFEPGDAHPLFYRAAKFRASKTIIITTRVVTANARKVFDEYYNKERGYPISIEGLNNVGDILHKLVSNAHLESVIEKCKILSERTQINLQPIFTKLFGKYFQEYKGKFN
jgi:hypothetical protein